MDDNTKSLFEMCYTHYIICTVIRRFNTYFGLQLMCSVLSHVLSILGELYIIYKSFNITSDFLTFEMIGIFLTALLEAVDMIIFIKHCGKTCPMVCSKQHSTVFYLEMLFYRVISSFWNLYIFTRRRLSFFCKKAEV